MASHARTRHAFVAGLLCVGLLAGCSTASDDDGPGLARPKLADLNPFGTAKVPLAGKRVSVLATTADESLNGHLETATGSIVLPPVTQLAEWTTPGGTASNAPGHLALKGNLATVWTADAGTGSSAAAKLTAMPIVHNGRVYVFDAANQVSAFSVSGGARAWSVKVAPDGMSGTKAFGGGIAAAGGRIFAVTGFGTALALDANTGAKLWEKTLGGPFHAAPTAADGRVFTTNTDGLVSCLSASDGSILWTFHGAPQQAAALLTNTRPAVSGDAVIVPFPSGDLVALKVDSGAPIWQENLNGARASATIAGLTDPASPVASGGMVFAVSRSGRMIADAQETGARAWSMNLSGVDMPWVAGDAIYVVDATSRLLALKRDTGEVRWAVKLPTDAKVWSGPVLAGGRLWVTSAKGLLAGIDPVSGQVTAQKDFGGHIYISPVVADGRMYVLTDKASLVALE